MHDLPTSFPAPNGVILSGSLDKRLILCQNWLESQSSVVCLAVQRSPVPAPRMLGVNILIIYALNGSSNLSKGNLNTSDDEMSNNKTFIGFGTSYIFLDNAETEVSILDVTEAI